LGIESFRNGVRFFPQKASLLTQRYEKKFGRDENTAVPRCLMAAKFISAMDITGDNTLKHWISQGQIQDLSMSIL
jgi:hypothetical protein